MRNDSTMYLSRKMKKSMQEHLDSVGWQYGQNKKVINELSEIWKKMESEGLAYYMRSMGITQLTFITHAYKKYKSCELNNR